MPRKKNNVVEKKQHINAIIIFPITEIKGWLFGSPETIEVEYRFASYVPSKRPKIIGENPVSVIETGSAEDDVEMMLEEHLKLNKFRSSLKDITNMAASLGLSTIIVAVMYDEDYRYLKGEIDKYNQEHFTSYSVSTVLESHESIIRNLTRFFRVVEIDANYLLTLKKAKIEQVKEKAKEFINAGDYEQIKTLLQEISQINITLTNRIWYRIHPHISAVLMAGNADMLNYYDYFKKQFTKSVVYFLVVLLISLWGVPILVKPAIAPLLPNIFEVKTIDVVKLSPIIGDIKGMYIPALPEGVKVDENNIVIPMETGTVENATDTTP